MIKKLFKLFYVVIISVLTISLIGCKKDEEKLLQEYLELIEVKETVNADFYLPYYVNNNNDHCILWESSNTSVMFIEKVENNESYYVTINTQSKDVVITLTATIKLNSGLSKDKQFTVTVEGQSLKEKYNCITIAEAIKIAKNSGEAGSSKLYYVYGTIVKVTNPTYGEMLITDGENELSVYGTKDENDVLYGSWTVEKPVAGDEVVLYGKLKMFNDSPEMDRSVIKEFNHITPVVDEKEYVEKTIKEARECEEGTKLKLTGVVANITNAFGQIPNGFYLVDKTGSIYVYGSDAAQQVSVGNTVTIGCEKTYYINPDELNNANKYHYEGALQVQNPILLSNDKGNTDFDKTWIEETTVKKIIDTPMSNNITSNIYKVNAYVNKVPGSGFINYYINDLDGKTGSYVYTMCNGNDFTWLDKFDGKICTIYLSPINCKATTGGMNYRFIPIVVEDNNYKFDLKDACEYAITYHILNQFKDFYQNNPKLKVISSVSSDLLGFEDVQISYQSSNTDVVYFENNVMHTKNDGQSIITVLATYGEYKYTSEIIIKVEKSEEVPYSSIADILSSDDNTLVTVRGIVASSLINQVGFYLIDETGVVAVTCSGDVLSGLELGQDIIVQGTIGHRKKDAAGLYAGQIEIANAKVLVNYYGENEYSKSSFIYDKTVNDICDLDFKEDHSAEVYVVKGKIKYVAAEYYTNYYVVSEDGSSELLLYSSNGSQYSWLKEFVDEVLTIEIAPVNWNSKNNYRGCIVSVSNGEKTVVNNFNFSK